MGVYAQILNLNPTSLVLEAQPHPRLYKPYRALRIIHSPTWNDPLNAFVEETRRNKVCWLHGRGAYNNKDFNAIMLGLFLPVSGERLCVQEIGGWIPELYLGEGEGGGGVLTT